MRNRGTIGGNVCSNDPTNHFPPLLAALGAELTIAGPNGERTVSTDEFFEGVFLTAVHPGELLTSIRIPAKGDARDGWATVDARQGRHRASSASPPPSPTATRGIAIGCVAATPVVVTASADETAVARRRPRRRARSARRRPCLGRLPAPSRRGARRSRRQGRRVSDHTVAVSVNGERYEREVEARKLLVHFIRDDLDLTGTHVGCDTGNCGACTVLLDGTAVKSCMLLAPRPTAPRSRPSRASPATTAS